MSSQENPDDTILPEENFTEHPDMPKTLPRSPPITMADSYAEISNLELHTALLALAQQATLLENHSETITLKLIDSPGS